MAGSSDSGDKDAYIKRLEAQLKEMNDSRQAAKADEAKKAAAALKAFQSCRPSEYHGSSDPTVTERWIREMELLFETCSCEESKKVTFARTQLRGSAIHWWDSIRVTSENLSWGEFLVILRRKYCSDYDMEHLEQEFLALRKGDRPVDDLIYNFSENMRFVSHLLPTKKSKISRFANALPAEYRAMVRFATTSDMAFDIARQIESDFKYRQEQWGGQFKRKIERVSEERHDISGSGSRQEATKQTKADHLWCARCRSYHSGDCTKNTMRCVRCGQRGHELKDCQYRESVCYKCRKPGHQISKCSAGSSEGAEGTSSGLRRGSPS